MSARHPSNRPDYLRVDDFIETLVDARVLASAFELGLVDFLASRDRADVEAVRDHLGLTPWSLGLLVELLQANGVLAKRGDSLALTDDFLDALEYRDLLEVKLDFSATALPDLTDSFTQLLSRPDEFVKSSKLLELFRYDRCFEATPENLAHTRRWIRFTTTLTKYESGACMQHFDFGTSRRILDVGGNSGEFMLRVCKAHPQLEATVFDLPVVCEIGEQHVAPHPEARRIHFVRGDARHDAWPEGHDLITFKSVLHDWPERDALRLIGRAVRALTPGGNLLIFERGTLEIGDETPPYSMIPNILFSGYYRSPAVYARHMEKLGLQCIDVVPVGLEMTFHIVTARKAA